MNNEQAIKFAERLEQALDTAGFPRKGRGRLTEVAKLFGISSQAVARWLNGEIFPSKRVNEIATKLSVNPHWLLTGQGNSNPHSTVIFAPGTPLSLDKDLTACNWQQVPIISWEQAGKWHIEQFIPSEHTQYIWATTETTNQHFALVVEDDSMEPRFYTGNILIFDPALTPAHKNRVLVRWKKSHQVSCGILMMLGPSMLLKLHNPDYKPISLDDQNEFEFIAVCRQVFIIEDDEK